MAGPGARPPVVDPTAGTGVVAAFDEHAGLGRIAADDGTELAFHCTALADGTRTVAVGARVAFRVVAAHGGSWQAAAVLVA
jgi:cold shock CspA family protein